MSRVSIDSFENNPSKGTQLSDNVIIFYFFMAGGAMSLGWYATSNSYNYFEAMFPSYNVTFVFPLAIYTSQLLSIFAINKICSLVSYQVQILCCLVINILIVICLSLEAHIFQGTIFGMFLSMALLFCLGFSNNLGYCCVTGFASTIGPKYTVYAMIGVSFFGLMESAIKALVLWIFSASSDGTLLPTLVYYIIAAFLIVITLALHITFVKSEFYLSHYLKQTETEDMTTINLVEKEPMKPQLPQRNMKTLLSVCKEVKLYLFLLFILYIQMDLTLPGVMLKKPMPSMAPHTKTVSMMTTFTICLLIGKKLSQYRNYYNIKTVIGVILGRFLLNAFFIIQAVAINLPVLGTEWFGYLNVALFGVTSGFANVSLFILTADKVHIDKKEPAIFLCVFTVNIGAIVGGFSALSLRNIGPS